MNALYLRFVRGTGLDSKIIEYTTHCWMSHVELQFGLQDRALTFGAQLKGGVVWRYTTDKCYRDVDRWEVWRVPVTHQQHHQAMHFIARNNGKKYDWMFLVANFGFNRDWRNPERWWCSEFDMALLEHLKVIGLFRDLPVNRITPRDVYFIIQTIPGVSLVECHDRHTTRKSLRTSPALA